MQKKIPLHMDCLCVWEFMWLDLLKWVLKWVPRSAKVVATCSDGPCLAGKGS